MSDKPTFKAGDDVEVLTSLNVWVVAKYYRPDFLGRHEVKTSDNRYMVAVIPQNIRPAYADYDGGKEQYDADVATLKAAGLLDVKSFTAMIGQHDFSGIDGNAALADSIDVLGASTLKYARVAHALSRFMPWALARLNVPEGDSNAD